MYLCALKIDMKSHNKFTKFHGSVQKEKIIKSLFRNEYHHWKGLEYLIVYNPHIHPNIQKYLYDLGKIIICKNPKLSKSIQIEIATSGSENTRLLLAQNKNIDIEIIQILLDLNKNNIDYCLMENKNINDDQAITLIKRYDIPDKENDYKLSIFMQNLSSKKINIELQRILVEKVNNTIVLDNLIKNPYVDKEISQKAKDKKDETFSKSLYSPTDFVAKKNILSRYSAPTTTVDMSISLSDIRSCLTPDEIAAIRAILCDDEPA
jgi:hypothetical protein